jgi:hypothetical protein
MDIFFIYRERIVKWNGEEIKKKRTLSLYKTDKRGEN